MSSVLRDFLPYMGGGALCGYWLAVLLFFDNRLPLTSVFFLKLAFCLVAVYGLIGLIGGVLADMPWRLSRCCSEIDRQAGRTGLFVGTGLFATLFFWHFDSFYPYSTFGLWLLIERLLTESFAPTSWTGLRNLGHLALLVAVAASLGWGTYCLRANLSNKILRIAALIGVLAPWPLEAYFALAGAEDITLRGRPGRKVLIIGVDALDWNYTREYMAAGELPSLQRLANAGVITSLETFAPAYSPQVWTTIATGMPIAEHNIRHFTAYSFDSAAAIQPLVEPSLLLGNPYVLRLLSQAGLLQARYVTVNTRQVPALWNISSQAGLATAVLGWWASSPAERVAGVMVGDYASHTDLTPAALDAHVYPAEMAKQVSKDLAGGRDWPEHWEAGLFALTEAERRQFVGADKPSIIRETERSLIRDYGLFNVASRILQGKQPALTAVFFEGIDTIGHLALHFERSTDLASLDSVDVRRYGGLNRVYYRVVDEMIGELVASADEQTTICILADHGFELHEEPNYFHHKTGPPGVLLLAGPEIAAGDEGEIEAHIYDIAPTVLYALGLPVGEDMPGRVLKGAFRQEFRDRYAVERLASYGGLRSARHQQGSLEAVIEGAGESAVKRLKALGYIE